MQKLTFEETLKIAIDQTIEGIQILNNEWEYVYVNTAAANHGRTTKDKLVGCKMPHCYPGIEQTPLFRTISEVMKTRLPQRVENHFEYPDGKKCWFELYIEPHSEGILIRSMDITERKKIEEQYFQAKKLEAIGQIAGGVAHDFNNKLGIILAYGEMLSSKLESHHINLKSYSDKIIKAVHQASKLTKQLLAFSRKQILDYKVVNLNDLLRDVEHNLRKIFGENVQMRMDLAPDLELVHTDLFQLEQMILNLCSNARDAMPDGGIVHIETANVDLDEEYIKLHNEVVPGPYVMLAITDTGSGMDPKTLSQVFDPFFTTKARGKGTGLGLAMVHGFVRQSNGYIWSYSEVDRGTVFKIYLPSAPEEVGGSARPNEEEKNFEGSFKGHETILLAEDEPHLREGYTTLLKSAGYHVISVKDAEEAIKVYLEYKDKVDLLLTDVILPVMTGADLARELRSKTPELKVIFMSGYTANFIAQQGILDENQVLLQKPIFAHNLLKNVRGVLDKKIKKGLV